MSPSKSTLQVSQAWSAAAPPGGAGPVACHPAMSRHARPTPRGFSLAEMMIALAILAMGLLVIGASLPLGVQVTRETVNMAEGEAAVEYALDTLEQSLSVRRDIIDGSDFIAEPSIFVPRDSSGLIREIHEPLIKVRPLLTQTVSADPSDDVVGFTNSLDIEAPIRVWLQGMGYDTDQGEVDPIPSWLWPAVPCTATTYPPVEMPWYADTVPGGGSQAAGAFFDGPYEPRAVQLGAVQRVRSQRVSWCAFYRRMSYATNADPMLYELIVVAVRRPSENHRFPVQTFGTTPTAAGPVYRASVEDTPFDGGEVNGRAGVIPGGLIKPPGADGETETGLDDDKINDDRGGYQDLGTQPESIAPVPWLWVFTTLPQVPPVLTSTDGTRQVNPNFEPPANLIFVADETLGELLPPKSIFIPARNDRDPTESTTEEAGFVPEAYDTLPIYEVVDRVYRDDGNYDIIVKNNGMYPWVDDASPPDNGTAAEWPVWIIPPAFEETDSDGNPLLSNRSPIVGVGRRVVQLRELP